jgi:ATP-binding cassette subfamily F protein uup
MAVRPALAHVKNLQLSLGGAPLFESAEFVLHKGERTAFIGANGAGKSTLMGMLAGLSEPDTGEITYASGAIVALAPQESNFEGFASLRDYARAPTVALANACSLLPAHAAEAALETFGLDPDRAASALSGGEMRRATLARALAADPDVLLLDEPTNHLDISAIQDLEQHLATFRGACLVISHDRRFLERVSTSTLWLRQRQLLKLDRGFSAFEEWAESVELEETRAFARLETHLKAEEHWLRRGVTARRSRNEGRRRSLDAMRAERRQRKALATSATAAINASVGAESAKLVLEARNLSKRYCDRPIISDFSLRVMRGDRLGVVGPNGAGKTTLVELLLQRRTPDSGSVRLGENLEIAYVDQVRALLNLGDTLWQALAPQGGDQVMVQSRPRHVAAYAQDFLFDPVQLRQPISSLSGGERNRLALAVALALPANLLVLDEPTNDLDVGTLDALESMLAAYEGTVIIVSHDRAFLDGVATQIVGPVGAGRWVETPGGWSDFEREHGGTSQRVTARRTSTPPPPPRQQTKLSYKDERRAADLEARLSKLHAEIEALEHALSQHDAFERGANAFGTFAVRLLEARAEKEASESEWLEIELLREHLKADQ